CVLGCVHGSGLFDCEIESGTPLLLMRRPAAGATRAARDPRVDRSREAISASVRVDASGVGYNGTQRNGT
ncbi:MAG: hypothetical protein WBB60_06350, partial [Nitrospira sp.]